MTKSKFLAHPITMFRRILMLILGYFYIPKLISVVLTHRDVLVINNDNIHFWLLTLMTIFFVIRKSI